MTIVLLRTKRGHSYAQKIQRAVLALGTDCVISEIAELEDCITQHDLKPENTLIHSRTAGPITNQKIAAIEAQGFRVINPSANLMLMNEKYTAHEHAEKHKLPVAATLKIRKDDTITLDVFLQKYKTVVIKPIYSQGQGVYCQKVSSDMNEQERLGLLESVPGDEIQVQEYIPYKRLIRVIVIDYRALPEATTYDEPTNSWKCSVCLNPNIKAYREDRPELFKLAERTARAFGAKVNFIDFFENQHGQFILNEINTACNLNIHERVTGVRIHEKIAEFLVGEGGGEGE